ncbi:MAG TPA: MBL fold metallo-hydrolase [Capillimicrobium sp.]|jgi:L-ascorbate metabolism protein UlaG (beta-lactamase superfamily)
MRVTWLGHATVLVEAGGARLLTDPVLRGRVAHLRRHAPPAAPPRDVDAVLVSHAHHDHLDLPTLRALGPVALTVVPPGAGRAVAGARELAPGASVSVGAARVTAVPAVHDVRRLPWHPASDAIGYLIEHDGLRAYFAGDTEPFAAMAQLRPLDLALLPIWGWGPSLGPGHMDPGEAAGALELLQPRVVVPIHWGTLLPIGAARRHGHLLRQPVADFRREAAARCPGAHVTVLQPGEDLTL